MFGFGILVSLWPFHTWAPLGYGSAPTGAAMIHAGVLKKFGLYGLIRIALPLMPDEAQRWAYILSALCLGNIVYCGLVAMRQRDLNLLIGNSSVAHVGFAFLGIASLSLDRHHRHGRDHGGPRFSGGADVSPSAVTCGTNSKRWT